MNAGKRCGYMCAAREFPVFWMGPDVHTSRQASCVIISSVVDGVPDLRLLLSLGTNVQSVRAEMLNQGCS